ncbi:DEHA2E20768p [Debaryomyces hansenii CBS767]|uniref:DEHA2E20768p n=1 Tax=Debaryomyces hansenii (strain ATCC 36239 / CBS 767 / BCRC 21394 / JCM 1990 / NBRC 0083 / IGC 2968) TaxID=284592 RepID=Q6BNL5_DEBHA|nr:DEHA2E20768p [Debaryomyces hansenii CBS767]CAG88478.2 DEHA2E20768p [Debaryomyces hansenii CBS767]|eukprot:XP_460205.2 DEHA2E20768p [Debaryomyces hansenii CBS767]
MASEDLVQLLNELSIRENEFDEAKMVLQGDSTGVKDLKKTYEILLKCSQIPKLSDNIYEIIDEDMSKFMFGLQVMDDSRGIIFINTIKSNVANEDLEKTILKTLSLIQTILKRNDSLGDIVFYLSLYFAIISNFNLSNPQHVSLMLQYLNPFHNQTNEEKAHEVYSLVLVIIIKNIELSAKKTTEVISSYLEILVDNEPDKISMASFLNLVKSLESLFPIVPSVSQTIYMSESCKGIILFQVSKMSSTSLEYTSNQLITTEILKLVTSSCINEQCRLFNYNNYLELLKIGTKLQGENVLGIRLLSSLGIIKLWNFIQLEKDSRKDSGINMSDLSDILISYLRSSESRENEVYLEYCIEGLAYLSLNTSIKQKLRNDETSIENILIILKKETEINDKILLANSSLVYGLLLILSNLTKLKDVAANSQKKTTNYLKSFATPNNINNSEDENQESIYNFSRSLLNDYKIVEIMSKIKVFKSQDSAGHNNDNIISQVITVISMISSNQDRSTRQELIKQGALNIVLDYLIKNSVVKKTLGNETRPSSLNDELVETRLLALRSLARILISVNPALAFNKYDIKTCLPFLIELLGPDISQYTGSLEDVGDEKYLYDGVSNLDKYESLLALTNISTVHVKNATNELRQLIISKIFDKYLDNFIIDSDLPQIQKAAWELISNLITEPSLLVKFFNIEKQENLKRLQLLIKLLDSTDESFQTVIGGLLANATSEFEMISQILVQNVTLNERLLSILTNIFENQNSNNDLLLRASYILLNLVYSASSLDAKYLDKFRENRKLKGSLGLALRSNKNKEILEMIIEIIKLVNFK